MKLSTSRLSSFALFALLCVGALFCPSSPASSRGARDDLSISPTYQQTPVWCWVAVGEMVFEHYSVPNVNPFGNYQCGVIGALAGPYSPCWRDCRYCTVPAGSMQNIKSMIETYPVLAGQLTGARVRRLGARYTPAALSESQVKEEIDNDRPVIAGINPTGFAPMPGQSMHVCLIVGYDEDEDGNLTLTVNDPFPYDIVSPGRPNPFDAAGGDSNGDGSYTIKFSNFRRNLVWNASIYGIS